MEDGHGPACRHGDGRRPDGPGIGGRVSSWAIVAILLSAASACADRPADHLILITIDTYRADHAFQSRAGTELTPALSAFAERAITFTAAQSTANCTSPATAAIMTGLLPHRAGVVRNIHIFPKRIPTLSTMLRKRGFRTAGIVSNPVLAPEFGFGRGFDTYQLLERTGSSTKVRADQVSRQALAWLDEHGTGQRFFLWVHYMEPHGPYEPPEPYAALFPKERFAAPRDIPLQPEGKSSGRGKIPYYQQVGGYDDPADGREYLARYAAEVRALDHALGEFLGELDDRDLLDRSVVVLTADHGEALADDHGYFFCHQAELTQDQVHVPLLLAHPSLRPGVVDRPVSTIDLLPTAFELLGLDLPVTLDGGSLQDGEERAVISQSPEEMTLREGPWKLTWSFEGEVTLVNLDEDPGELDDLAARHPERVERMRSQLEELAAAGSLVEPFSRFDLGQR